MAHAEVKRVGKAQKKVILELTEDQASIIAAALWYASFAVGKPRDGSLTQNSDMGRAYRDIEKAGVKCVPANCNYIGAWSEAAPAFGKLASIKVTETPAGDSPEDEVVLTMPRRQAEAMLYCLNTERPTAKALRSAGVRAHFVPAARDV